MEENDPFAVGQSANVGQEHFGRHNGYSIKYLDPVGQSATKMSKRAKYVKKTYSKRAFLVKQITRLLQIYDDLLGGWGYQTSREFIKENYPLKIEYQAASTQALLWQLVHYQTLINRTKRPEIAYKTWASEQEDLLAALVIMRELIELSKESIEYDRDAWLLFLIKKNYPDNQGFKRSQLYRKLRHPGMRELKLALRRLRESNHLKVIAGNRYTGYIYAYII